MAKSEQKFNLGEDLNMRILIVRVIGIIFTHKTSGKFLDALDVQKLLTFFISCV